MVKKYCYCNALHTGYKNSPTHLRMPEMHFQCVITNNPRCCHNQVRVQYQSSCVVHGGQFSPFDSNLDPNILLSSGSVSFKKKQKVLTYRIRSNGSCLSGVNAVLKYIFATFSQDCNRARMMQLVSRSSRIPHPSSPLPFIFLIVWGTLCEDDRNFRTKTMSKYSTALLVPLNVK